MTHVGLIGGLDPATVIVLFDLPMEWDSLAHAFTLTNAATGRVVSGRLAPFGESAALFRATDALSPHTSYVATVRASATADTGGRLRRAVRWSFATG